MPRGQILAIIQAGGAGGRMDVLTRERAKPALPFAGAYQLIDFSLSNLANSGITDIWLSVQYLGSTLEEEVLNGRPWDLDRTRGGLRLLMPQQGTGSTDEEGFATGNADELYRIRDRITAAEPELVVVLSADHVYRFDVMDAVRTHRRLGAECTLVTTEVSIEEAVDHATVEVDGDGHVTGFAYKPETPTTTTVAAEIAVYDPAALVEVVEELHRELGPDAGEGDTGLEDYGDHLVPRFLQRGRLAAHAMPSYWKDLGQPHKYLAAHRDLLTDDLDLLGDPAWPIISHQPQRSPARVLDGGRVVDGLLAPGSRVRGTVRRSVLGPGVEVAEGALVRDSVIFADTVIEEGARVDWSVVDRGCVIEAGAEVGSPDTDPDDPDAIVLIGLGSRVGRGVTLGAGSRLEPGSTA